MATNVSFLGDAMVDAGYRTNKELAEAAGVSSSTVSSALRRGTCNSKTAEKLQRACGRYPIGPYTDAGSQDDDTPRSVSKAREAAELDDTVLAALDAFPGMPWRWDRVGNLVSVVGTQVSESSGLVVWRGAVYRCEDPETAVFTTPETDSHWEARRRSLGWARAKEKDDD